jgi:peptidoglycan hydrolase-like protein with peptidoglycan-binding domain
MSTAHARKNNHSFALVIGIVAAGAAALATALIIMVAAHDGSTAATTTPAASASAPASPGGGSVTPSAAVVKLQQELGQLNYYNGPADGIMGPQTVQAITYLQRDAHLPQTGQMNPATAAALAHFLATGNNQMGG